MSLVHSFSHFFLDPDAKKCISVTEVFEEECLQYIFYYKLQT